MASDITQLLPLAASSLNSPPTNPVVNAAQRTAPPTPEKITQITQAAAAQASSKGLGNDKERGVPIPKKTEAGFAQEESGRDDSHDNKGKRLKLKA